MKILICAHTGVGNLILKFPFINAVKHVFHNPEIIYLGKKKYGIKQVIEIVDSSNKIIEYDDDKNIIYKIKFWSNLRKEHIDYVFLPFDSVGSKIAVWIMLIGAKKIFAHVFMHERLKIFLYSSLRKVSMVPILPSRHEIDLNYDLLQSSMDRKVRRIRKLELVLKFDLHCIKKYNLEINNYIVIQIGAANGNESAKVWRIENFIKLIEHLNANYSAHKIVLVGDIGDWVKCKNIIEQSKITIINTIGKTSLIDLFMLINNAKLIVCHDSAVMHIASILNKNTIALYGPTDFLRTHPV